MEFHLVAAVTLLTVLLYAGTILLVGLARWRHGIEAPSVTGHPAFERAYRVQTNTLEQMPVFLPSLWLAALYCSDTVAAILGLLFLLFRVLYAILYLRSSAHRGWGYVPGALCMLALWGLALWGLLGKSVV